MATMAPWLTPWRVDRTTRFECVNRAGHVVRIDRVNCTDRVDCPINSTASNASIVSYAKPLLFDRVGRTARVDRIGCFVRIDRIGVHCSQHPPHSLGHMLVSIALIVTIALIASIASTLDSVDRLS